MKKISIIALLTILNTLPAKAIDINLGEYADLAAALAAKSDGDVIIMPSGVTIDVGTSSPQNTGVLIHGNTDGEKGTLNFSPTLPGLILSGGIDIHSEISNVVLTGTTSVGYMINNSHTLLLDNLDMTNAFSIYNTGDITITSSSVTNNTASSNGGVIYNAAGSNLTVSNTLFDSNSVTMSGGVISNSGGTVTVDDTTVFSNNHAGSSGGAIYSSGDYNVTINGATFDGNSAPNGGAIYIISNVATLMINGGTTFIRNTAQGGGAIVAYANTIFDTTEGDIVFEGNGAVSGGAFANTSLPPLLDTIATLVSTTGHDLIFRNNTASADYMGDMSDDDAWTGGGAIACMLDGRLDLNSAAGNIIFTGNRADLPASTSIGGIGGAIYNFQQTISISVADGYDLIFDGNIAANGGGAIYNGAFLGAPWPPNTSTINIGNNAQFTNNVANALGDIDANLELMGGGAIANFGDAVMTIGNYSTFTSNTSGLHGGAILNNGASIELGNNASFQSNTASSNGGAIYNTGTDSIMIIGDNAYFGYNTATAGAGGAIHTQAGLTFNGNATFIGNTSTELGGAIAASGDTANIVFNMNPNTVVDFTDNTAGGVANDIHLIDSNNEVSFTGTGGVANLNGGISSDSVDANIYVGGNVVVNFGADSVNDSFVGKFNSTSGTTNVYADNWISGDNLISGGKLHLWESTITGGVDITTGGELDIRAFIPTMVQTFAASSENPQYNIVTMENFSGNGTGNIWMNTDGSQSGTDMLRINGTATGGAILNFTRTGQAPTDLRIEVIDYAGEIENDLFTLAGDTGKLDIGAWLYELDYETGDGWYLVNTGNLNATTQSVMGIPALHLSMVKTGMNELRKRLGHLRNNNDDDELVGAWVRAYGKHLDIHELVDADMNIGGVEGGIDFMANALNGKIYYGIMGGMMDSEDIHIQTFGGGASGWTRTPSVGAYLTWMHKSGSSSKWFVDLTARHFWAHTHVEKDDKTNGYDVTRSFWAFSAETGKLFYMKSPEWMNIGEIARSHVSIEPKLELRYKQGQAMDFETFAGDKGRIAATKSFSTHLNLQMNFLPNGTLSTWRPYVELGVYNEFIGATEMEFADVKLRASETEGLGFNATLGASAEVSEKTYVYGGYTFEHGQVYTSHQLNLGIRTKF